MNPDYIPFEKRYIKYRIINYGKPYTDYTKYTLANNIDDVAVIYIDNQPCLGSHDIQKTPVEELPHFIEIHHTPESGKSKIETIMKSCDLDNLIGKYICRC